MKVENLLLDKTIGLDSLSETMPEKFTGQTFYEWCLSGQQDGAVGQLRNQCKQLILSSLCPEERQDALPRLFEVAYGYGFTVDRQGFDT